MDKSCSWVKGEHGAPAVLLEEDPIPLSTTFRQLSVDVAIGGSKATGPVLSRRLEVGRSALRRLPHLSTYDQRERAINTLVTLLALHGVAVASVTGPDLKGLKTVLVRAPWGPGAFPGPRRSPLSSCSRDTACPRSCTRGMRASYGWPAWPAVRGSRRSLHKLFGSPGAAHLGRASWGARSARRRPWAGARAKPRGAGTSRGHEHL